MNSKKKRKVEPVEAPIIPTESVIQAEGTAHIADTEVADKERTSLFTVNAKINDYGFLHFKNAWLENLGWSKGMALKVNKNADGSITVRKA